MSSRPTRFDCLKESSNLPSSSVKRQRTMKVFEGYTVTEVRAGLNATVDSSLQRVFDITFCTVHKQLSSMSIYRDIYITSYVNSRTAIRSALSTP